MGKKFRSALALGISLCCSADSLDGLMEEVRSAGNQLIRKKEPISFVGWEKVLEDVQVFIQNQFPGFIEPPLLDKPTEQLKEYYGKKESIAPSVLEKLIEDIGMRQQGVAAKMRAYAQDPSENVRKFANSAGTLARFTLSMLLTAAEDFRQDLIAARSRSPAKKFFDDIADKGRKLADKIVEKTADRRFTLLSDRIDALVALNGSEYEKLMNDLKEFAQKYALGAITNDQNIRGAVGLMSSQIPSSVNSVAVSAQQGAKAAREKVKKSFGDSKYPYELYARMWERVEGLAKGKR